MIDSRKKKKKNEGKKERKIDRYLANGSRSYAGRQVKQVSEVHNLVS